MSNFETSARVEDQGHVHVTGVPFPTGTEVAVVVSAKRSVQSKSLDRVTQLFAALDKARNKSPVGPLNRAEFYDRDRLH